MTWHGLREWKSPTQLLSTDRELPVIVNLGLLSRNSANFCFSTTSPIPSKRLSYWLQHRSTMASPCFVPTRDPRFWSLAACYDSPSSSPSANELRRLVTLKDSDACERRKLELQRKASALDSTRLESPCTFVLHDFTQKKRKSKKWISEPFYTNPQGYKLCLSVHPRGCGNGRDSHVSVFVHLMWGEFDYQLAWPFQGEIQIKLLPSKRRQRPLQNTIIFDECTPQECSKQVEDGEMNSTGLGEPKFISH